MFNALFVTNVGYSCFVLATQQYKFEVDTYEY